MFFLNHFNLLIRCRSSVIKTFGKEANLIKEYYFWNNVRGKTFLSNLCHARISEPFDLFCTTHKGRSFSQYYYAVHKIMRSFRKYTCKHVRPLGQSEICGLLIFTNFTAQWINEFSQARLLYHVFQKRDSSVNLCKFGTIERDAFFHFIPK